MVAIKNILNDKSDKEKLNVSEPDLNDSENYDVYMTPTISIERRRARSRVYVRLLFLFTALLFGLFLVISGVMLYRFFSTPRSWHDFCIVKYRTPEKGYLIDNGGLNADDLADKPIFQPKETLDDDNTNENIYKSNPETGELKQEMTLNLTSQVEEINVPNQITYKHATFIHDFLNNYTCIFDIDGQRCFIFELDRNKISPPKSIIDMLHKTMRGYYLPDNVLIHQTMMVDKEIKDLKPYGSNIEAKCSEARSYLLKKKTHRLIGADHNIDKRSIEKRCEFASSFIHSSGKRAIAYDIQC